MHITRLDIRLETSEAMKQIQNKINITNLVDLIMSIEKNEPKIYLNARITRLQRKQNIQRQTKINNETSQKYMNTTEAKKGETSRQTTNSPQMP